MGGSRIIGIIYYVVVALSLSISCYLSYYGYLRHFEGLTVLWVAIIAVLLFAGDHLLHAARTGGRGLTGAVILLAIGVSMSWLSNFNHLYSTFMYQDVVSETLRREIDAFKNDLTTTADRLSSLDVVGDTNKRRARLSVELQNLREQMFDRNNRGCGVKCREHMTTIEAILGVKLTELAPPGPSAADAQIVDFFQRYSTLVDAALVSQEATTASADVDRLLAEIKEDLNAYRSPETLLASGAGLEALGGLSERSLDVQRKANALLPAGSEVVHARINPGDGRLWYIPYTLPNAFIERPNVMATLVSALLALAVDAIPVIFAFAAFRPDSKRPTGGQPVPGFLR